MKWQDPFSIEISLRIKDDKEAVPPSITTIPDNKTFPLPNEITEILLERWNFYIE